MEGRRFAWESRDLSNARTCTCSRMGRFHVKHEPRMRRETAESSPMSRHAASLDAQGYAFLEFRTVEEASNAIAFDGVQYKDTNLKVSGARCMARGVAWSCMVLHGLAWCRMRCCGRPPGITQPPCNLKHSPPRSAAPATTTAPPRCCWAPRTPTPPSAPTT